MVKDQLKVNAEVYSIKRGDHLRAQKNLGLHCDNPG